jgi:hypothetical protein
MTGTTEVPEANRRRYPRYPSYLGVRFLAGPEEGYGCTLNVAPGGLLLRTHRALEVGTVVEGKLQLESGQKVSFVGQVRWTGPVPGGAADAIKAGIQFMVMPEAEYYQMLTQQAAKAAAGGDSAGALPLPKRSLVT